jgi:hypothetical protein
MGRLAKADQPRHIAHGDRRLLDQQLRGDIQTAAQQILAKGPLSKLPIDTGKLARRAAKRASDFIERQRPPVMACDDDTSL